MEFINPKTDFWFKKIFASPQSIELVFLELPKFNQKLEQVQSLIQSWVYFLKNAPNLDEIPDKLASVPEIQTAFNIANKSTLNLEDLSSLEKR